MRIRLWPAVFALAFAAWWGVSPARALTDEEVGKAIEKLRAEIYRAQDPKTGSWDQPGRNGGVRYGGGESALATLALLISGESAQRPELAKAIAYLRTLEVASPETYAVGLRAHVWAHLPEPYLKNLREEAAWLESAALEDTTFTYGNPKDAAVRRGGGMKSGGDHSNTQYGLLGLWEAAKRGVRFTSGNFWERVIDHWVKVQSADGGWSYSSDRPGSPSYGSMTAAGLTALLVAQQEVYRNADRPDGDARRKNLQEALLRGLDWMDQKFKGDANAGRPVVGGHLPYYFYGVERVALASGYKDFNGLDWYKAGAETLLRGVAKEDRQSLEDACFTLMFLCRGRVPVWITKLRVPGARWNNHPNDIYFLNQFVSTYREGEVNWQSIALDKTSAEELRTAPILYLASDQALDFTPAQQAMLRRYLDLGGSILANPDFNSQAFQGSIIKLGKALYPDRAFRALPPSHELFTAQHRVSSVDETVMGLSNGDRELILMPTRDWGFRFQSEDLLHRSAAWKLAANLFVLATDRGVLENRLVERVEPRARRDSEGSLAVACVSYKGRWQPEPLAWEPLGTRLFNRSGLELTTVPAAGQTGPAVAPTGPASPAASTGPAAGKAPQTPAWSLDNLGDCDCKLAHLGGLDPLELAEAQKTAIKTYILRGGTLLIENIGGTGQFTISLEKQLQGMFDAVARPLNLIAPDHPLLTGSDLPGGYDVSHVTYRRFAAWATDRPGNEPQLLAFFVQNRPAVIISNHDLSLGLLDVRHWGINGYSPESARQIMTNILLWADQQQVVPPGSTAPVPAVRIVRHPAGAAPVIPAPPATQPAGDPAIAAGGGGLAPTPDPDPDPDEPEPAATTQPASASGDNPVHPEVPNSPGLPSTQPAPAAAPLP